MNILFVTENLGSGGAERQLTRLAALLKNAGYNVSLATWGKQQFHADYLRENDIEHVMIPDYPKAKRVLRLAKLYRNRRPDAVISYLPMANETAIMARMFAHVPRLIVSERSFTSSWSGRIRLRYFLYRFADRIVANSNNEAENIRVNVPAIAGKVVSIPNFVEIDRFHAISHAVGKPMRMISVGRVIPTKNVIKALQALRIVIDKGYDCTLDWYGDTYDTNYVKEVRDAAKRLCLDSRFILRGQTNKIAEILPTYDIFFFPSLLEGYPNVLCEAMACCLPVVCSNAGEMQNILTNDKGGFLFNPNSIDEIAEALKHIMSLPNEKLLKMGEYNRNAIETYNSPDSVFSQYISLL